MTNNEFLAWLEGYAEAHQNMEFDDPDIFDPIIEKAKELEESTQFIPYYPPQTYPVWPPTTWLSTTTHLAKDAASTALNLLPNPNDWSVSADGDGNWSIVRKN